MENYRDTATALARGRPEQYVGVVYYAEVPHAGVSSRWDVQTFPRLSALREWYGEIAPSRAWYYYVAAFDKTRGSLPVGELTAPLERGQPAYAQRTVSGAEVGGGKIAGFAKTVGLFALVAVPVGILLSRSKERRQAELEKAEFRRLGWDWEKRHS